MDQVKTPLGLTFGSLAVLGAGAVRDVASFAQELGYQSLWTVEATGTDAFTLLGSVSAVAPQLDLATGILKQHGVEVSKRPIAMMREYVALLRECLSGESVTFAGDFWQVKRFRLGVRLGQRKPRIVMAALNPKMLKLAGEIADGVLLNYLPASHITSSVEKIRSGGNARIFSYVHAAVGDFEKHAGSARKDLFNYAMADSYANMFRSAGFADDIDDLRTRQLERDREGALAAISEKMIQAIDYIGSEAGVTSFVQSYIDAGVEHPVLMPLPWGEDRAAVTRQTMAAAVLAAQEGN